MSKKAVLAEEGKTMKRNISILLSGLFFGCLIFTSIFVHYGIGNAQKIQVVDKQIAQAVYAEDWTKVIELLGSVDNQTPSPVHRMIKGHADLALNRNNESLCLFLSVSSEDDIRRWAEWSQDFLKKNPKSVIAYYFMGDALARQELWDEALKAFNKAIEINPKNAMVLNARGVVYAAKGEWDDARNDFKEAIEVNPSFAETYASRGTFILQRKTDAKIALDWFDRALEISPDYVLALNGRGGVKNLLQEWDMAVPDFEKAKKLTTGCLSEIAGVVDLNFALLVDERNKAVSIMLSQLGGVDPGMSIDEKITMMDTWTPSQRQTGFDLLNNANNFNSKVQGGFWNPTKTEIGISAGFKGSIIGPQPFLKGEISVTKDWTTTAKFNQSHQIESMSIMSNRYGITRPNPISDMKAWVQQHMPGMDYGKLTKPRGVSSREIGDRPVDTGNWNVFTLYGLLYKMKPNAISPEDKEK